jgi:hypothetical protein
LNIPASFDAESISTSVHALFKRFLKLFTGKSFEFFLTGLAADTKFSHRPRFKPFDIDFLSAAFTDSERVVLDFLQRSFELKVAGSMILEMHVDLT